VSVGVAAVTVMLIDVSRLRRLNAALSRCSFVFIAANASTISFVRLKLKAVASGGFLFLVAVYKLCKITDLMLDVRK